MSVYFTASQNGFSNSWTVGESSCILFIIIIFYKYREQAFEVSILIIPNTKKNDQLENKNDEW